MAFAPRSLARSPILVIEDDEDLRESVCEFLAEEGYPVRSAKDGADALERLAELPVPCLVLLDMTLPLRNGVQVMEAARANPALASIPFAAFTADARAAPSGVVATLRKPFDVEELLNLIARYCH